MVKWDVTWRKRREKKRDLDAKAKFSWGAVEKRKKILEKEEEEQRNRGGVTNLWAEKVREEAFMEAVEGWKEKRREEKA